jgi:nucleotide-binding universal stress UspA family protein
MATAKPTVLVGYDGSEPARRALEHAADLVGRGGSLSVIHVIPTQSLSSRLETVSESERTAQDRLLEESERALARRGVSAELVGAAGDPAMEILAVAESIGAGIIVIGRRRRSTRHLVRTSLSSTLVRRAGTDVLVVHQE